MTRALLATKDEQVARRYAGVLRAHRGTRLEPGDRRARRARARADGRHFKGKATADQLVLERVLAELIADVAPGKHVELLFERAKRLRKAGKSVEAFGSLKPLLRSRADLDAAIDDDQRFFLAQLSLEAAGEGLLRADAHRRSGVRAVRAARREGLPGREEPRERTATSPTSSSTRSASA